MRLKDCEIGREVEGVNGKGFIYFIIKIGPFGIDVRSQSEGTIFKNQSPKLFVPVRKQRDLF